MNRPAHADILFGSGEGARGNPLVAWIGGAMATVDAGPSKALTCRAVFDSRDEGLFEVDFALGGEPRGEPWQGFPLAGTTFWLNCPYRPRMVCAVRRAEHVTVVDWHVRDRDVRVMYELRRKGSAPVPGAWPLDFGPVVVYATHRVLP